MKINYFLFCILCMMLLNFIHANADKQMKQDTQKVHQMGYTM
jgi:hypothetical protein